MKKKLIIGAVAAVTVLGASQAQAAVFDAVGDSTSVAWLLDPDGAGPLDPVSATATLTAKVVTDSTLELWVELKNTTGGSYTNAGLASFGFSVAPDAKTVSGATGGGVDYDSATDTDRFFDYSLDDIPSLKLVEICAWAGNNCNGGAQGDLLAKGETDLFKIVLTFDPVNASKSYTINDFGVKFQTSADSYEFYGSETTEKTTEETTERGGGTSTGPTASPEPALLSMLGVGLAGAAYRLRRR